MKIESDFDLYDTVYFISEILSGTAMIQRGLVAEITFYDHKDKGPTLGYTVFKVATYDQGEWLPYTFRKKKVDVVYATLEQALEKLDESLKKEA